MVFIKSEAENTGSNFDDGDGGKPEKNDYENPQRRQTNKRDRGKYLEQTNDSTIGVLPNQFTTPNVTS